MSASADDIDMDADVAPEDDEASLNGPTMMWFGFVAMGGFALWDHLAATPPSNPTYVILGVWLMLATCLAIVEVAYR